MRPGTVRVNVPLLKKIIKYDNLTHDKIRKRAGWGSTINLRRALEGRPLTKEILQELAQALDIKPIRLLFAGSGATYDDVRGKIDPPLPPRPRTVIRKFCGTAQFHELCALGFREVVSPRFLGKRPWYDGRIEELTKRCYYRKTNNATLTIRGTEAKLVIDNVKMFDDPSCSKEYERSSNRFEGLGRLDVDGSVSILYTVKDRARRQSWAGVCVLYYPKSGKIHGYWMSAGQAALGRIVLGTLELERQVTLTQSLVIDSSEEAGDHDQREGRVFPAARGDRPEAVNAIDLSMEDLRRLIEPELLKEHPETGPVCRQRVIEQQAQFHRFLRFNGVEVKEPKTQPAAFCQVFTRDPCFAVRDTLFLGSLRDSYRHPEVAGLVDICRESSTVAALWGNGAMIEGGDVFVIDDGKTVLVGMHRHTNQAGFDHLAQHLRASGVDVVAVPHKALHLDCCFAPLPNGEALIAGDKLSDKGRQLLGQRFQLIELDKVEASLHLAANLFWLDERRVVSGSAARKTNELLRSKGYEVHELDFSQMVCMWGSLRCVTCPLVRG